jgi:hypothetical protein
LWNKETNGLTTNSPDSLMATVVWFGMLWNHWKWRIITYACIKIQHALQNAGIIISPAKSIAILLSKRKGTKVFTPETADIQKLLATNTDLTTKQKQKAEFKASTFLAKKVHKILRLAGHLFSLFKWSWFKITRLKWTRFKSLVGMV